MVTKSPETKFVKFIHSVVELSRPLKYQDTSPILSHNIDSDDILFFLAIIEFSPHVLNTYNNIGPTKDSCF